MDNYVAFGRGTRAKQLVADYWGSKLGMGMIVLGALALVGLHTTKGE